MIALATAGCGGEREIADATTAPPATAGSGPTAGAAPAGAATTALSVAPPPSVPSGTTAGASTTGAATTVTTVGTTESSMPAGGAGSDFCDGIVGIGDDLSLTDPSADWGSDPAANVERLAVAAERFSTVEPPDAIAVPWHALSEFFTMADTALDGVDVTDPEAIAGALRFEGEEAFAMVLTLPGQVEMVGTFVQDECGVDLGIVPPVLVDVCGAVDPAHLGSVFGDAAPDGETRRWGQGVVECMWDDRGGTEIGVVVGPVDSVRPDLLQGLEPIDTASGADGPIDVYDGAVGPLRAASGRTAATEVGSTAILVSVRTGDMEADAMTAIELTSLVAERLG